MGCCHSHIESRPNLFQRHLCVHNKCPASDHYLEVAELGKGAFGVVSKVVHKKSDKEFAMKTVTFAKGSQRHEFEKEMDILRGLHHPNIVRMVETFEDDHHFYIIMELCTAGTFFDKVKKNGCEFPEESVKDTVAKLASVIQYLHSRFICHRDLKLENILVEADELGGDFKLCDFGASTLFRMGVTMRKVLGSVVYMAPEVLEGNYSQSCDLWSLGVIMYMLLSNTPPFYGPTEDVLIERIFDAKVSFDGPVWEKVSPGAKALIRKLLNPNPAERYTATQVLNHPWIKSLSIAVPNEVYDEFVPRLKAFCNYSPLQRAALVALAFCIPSYKITQHSAVYNELNIAHNGILTLQEMHTAPALQRFGLDTDKIYNALDQQHENGVNLLEFVAATLSPEDVTNETFVRMAFRLFDREHTGDIGQHELLHLLGSHFDKAACGEMIKRSDADKDGKIGYDDFAKMMKLTTRHVYWTGRCGGNTTPTKSDPGHAPFREVTRYSTTTRSISSVNLDTTSEMVAAHTRGHIERRRSSNPQHFGSEFVGSDQRAENGHQEQVAAEIAHVSRAEALQKIQSMSLDVKQATSTLHKIIEQDSIANDPGSPPTTPLPVVASDTPSTLHANEEADTALATRDPAEPTVQESELASSKPVTDQGVDSNDKAAEPTEVDGVRVAVATDPVQVTA